MTAEVAVLRCRAVITRRRYYYYYYFARVSSSWFLVLSFLVQVAKGVMRNRNFLPFLLWISPQIQADNGDGR